MTYDFDIPTERHGTDCLKFDRAEKRGRSADLLSLWVADMDFPTAPEIVDAIIERTKHGIFGYTEPGAEYFAALDNWLAQRYGWHVTEDEVTVAPGVVYALAMAVRAFTEPGDAVIIQQPVYYPFSFVVTENERTLVNAQLAYDGKRYHIDFEELERLIEESNAKLFILCNPHNPVGRAWAVGELEQLGKICLRHGVVVVSDEIHMDFARPGIEHVPFATLNEQFAQNCVACTSASKTFNLAGLQVANIVIPNKDLRRAFRDEVISTHRSGEHLPRLDRLPRARSRRLAAGAFHRRRSEALARLRPHIRCRGRWLHPHQHRHATFVPRTGNRPTCIRRRKTAHEPIGRHHA